jgi:hypothetical protein
MVAKAAAEFNEIALEHPLYTLESTSLAVLLQEKSVLMERKTSKSVVVDVVVIAINVVKGTATINVHSLV